MKICVIQNPCKDVAVLRLHILFHSYVYTLVRAYNCTPLHLLQKFLKMVLAIASDGLR
ncbi:hypothetical protein [Nostoc sp.]|uniref:hypothetical protein n=1 Tax=Nostoc sp. TaxID=1180 RepID=UPI002FF4DB9A